MLFELLFLILATLFLGSAVLAIVLPFLGIALNIVAGVLLTVSLFVLILLLALWRKWKQAGKLERPYIDSFTGARRFALEAIKLLIPLGILWEVLVLLACAAFLIFQPLDALPPGWPLY